MDKLQLHNQRGCLLLCHQEFQLLNLLQLLQGKKFIYFKHQDIDTFIYVLFAFIVHQHIKLNHGDKLLGIKKDIVKVVFVKIVALAMVHVI